MLMTLLMLVFSTESVGRDLLPAEGLKMPYLAPASFLLFTPKPSTGCTGYGVNVPALQFPIALPGELCLNGTCLRGLPMIFTVCFFSLRGGRALSDLKGLMSKYSLGCMLSLKSEETIFFLCS